MVEARFRDRFGLTVIGLRRGVVAHERSLLNEELTDRRHAAGDRPLEGHPASCSRTAEIWSCSICRPSSTKCCRCPARRRRRWSAWLLVVGLMVSGVVPNVQAALIGCLLMGALGCVDLNSAYRSIDWKTIVLIVGMLPFSIALQRTGGVELAADGLMALIGGAGTYAVLATLFAITALLGHVHLQHGHGRADGPGRARHRRRTARLALSVRDDRRAGRLDRVHDARLVAGEHAGGRARATTPSATSCASACRSA